MVGSLLICIYLNFYLQSIVLDSEFVSCLETLSTFTSGSNHTPYRCGAWSWLLERQEYKTWHGEVLTCAMIYVQRSSAYVNGVLLGPLLTRLREDDRTSSLLIHFSFDQQIERQGSIKSLLSSLICQILSSRPSLFSLLKSLYLLIREEAFWTDQELWLLLRILVSSRECINIVAVIDASGYSHDSQYRLLEKLAEFTKELRSNQVQSPRATFKVLLIGKVPPADTLPPILYVLSAQIGQEIDRIDLKLYVECRILDLIEKRPMLAAFAAEILAKLCDATKPPDIVLASLVLSHLQTVKLHSTMRFITGFLKKMPQSVRSFIEVPLKSLPPWASNAVSWMIYAMRPLTAKELALAIALTPHLTCLESVRDQVPLDIVADLQSIFGVLVRVDGAAVRFIHPQVKQEIMQSRAYCSSDIASHWDITELCLTYLTVDEIRNREFTDGNCETSLPQTWHFDFIEYAVKYWPTHARRAIIEPVHLERIIKCLSSKATMRKWCQLETDISYVPACRRNSLVSPLYFAAQHGLQDVVQTLLSKESVHAHDNCSQRLTLALSVRNGFHKVARLLIDHNPENLSVREDALYGACARGDIDMVKFLLTKLSLESVQASVLQKMISRAARVGFMSVIEQLVNAGAPLDTTLRLPEEKSAGREDIVSGEMPRYVTDLWPSYRSLTSKRCPLHYSAENGHHAIVRFLLKHGAPINAVDETDSTPLLLAVINGHTGTVAELYQHRQPKVDVRVPNSSGLTALHYAVQKGFADIARLLLQKNPDLEARAVDGSRPLHLATTNEREDIVNLLLLSGADINALDGKKHTALYRAAKRGSKVVTKLLMTNGADPNLEDLCGDPNPLMQAAANGLDTAVNYMLQKGANVNVADAEGYTALHHAAAHGHTEIVNELLNRGADPHRRAKYGQLPLYLAAEVGSRRTVEALLDPGADGIGLQNSSIATASQIAATAGHADTVEALLEKSANVNATDERGRNLIHLASLYCHHEVVSELLRKRLDPTAQDDLGWTPLHYAASGGSEIVVRLLLEQEDGPPDLEAKDHDGWTPFHIAAQKGHIEIMEELGQRHVNIEAQTNDGRTPLHFAYNQVNAIDWLLAHWVSIDKLDYAGKTVFTEAVENGVTASIEELLSRGLNLKLQDPQGRSYVHIAASHDQWETLKLLKQQGCDMNVMDKQKRTILHHAAVGGNLTAKNILQSDWLRECDFTVNSADQDGWTMLHWACKGLSLQAIQLMIDKGADPYQAGKENWTPYRVAVYHCREDIALYLKSIAAQLAYASGQEDSLPARYTPKSICRGCNGVSVQMLSSTPLTHF